MRGSTKATEQASPLVLFNVWSVALTLLPEPRKYALSIYDMTVSQPGPSTRQDALWRLAGSTRLSAVEKPRRVCTSGQRTCREKRGRSAEPDEMAMGIGTGSAKLRRNGTEKEIEEEASWKAKGPERNAAQRPEVGWAND